jgi:hypothetical protein
MTARKKTTTPEPQQPVTVAELLLALATYPLDAPLSTYENGGGGGAIQVELAEGEAWVDVWTGTWDERPHRRVEEIVKVVRRTDPLDDFAAAKEFLEWLQGQRYGMPRVSTGGGHNEPTTYRDLGPAELALEFAEREAGTR